MKLLQSHRRVPWLTATSLLYSRQHRVDFGRSSQSMKHTTLRPFRKLVRPAPGRTPSNDARHSVFQICNS